MHEVIVVGARCAGAATAMLLARAGHSILMVDQAGFPSETMSTRYIHQPGVARLEEWDVLPSVLEAGTRAITYLSHRVDDVTIAGPLPALGAIDFAIAPRREVLDQQLVCEAQAMGAEFRAHTKVAALLWEGERVAGVAVRGPDGVTRYEAARVVIGADGMRSTVARLAGAAVTVDDGRRTFAYYSQWRLGGGAVRLVESSGRYLSMIPTDGDVCLLATYAPQAEFRQARTDAMAFHRGVIASLAPDLAGRCVSDAAVDAALAEYTRRRDAVLLESYQATLGAAELVVTDRRLAALADVARSPERTQMYLGVMAGMRSAEELVPV